MKHAQELPEWPELLDRHHRPLNLIVKQGKLTPHYGNE
jgi:hypothetical protein